MGPDAAIGTGFGILIVLSALQLVVAYITAGEEGIRKGDSFTIRLLIGRL